MVAAGIFTIAGMVAWQNSGEHINDNVNLRGHYGLLGIACFVVAGLLGAHVIGS